MRTAAQTCYYPSGVYALKEGFEERKEKQIQSRLQIQERGIVPSGNRLRQLGPRTNARPDHG